MGKYGIYVFLCLITIIASVSAPAFLRPQNIKDILFLASFLGIVSIGQTFVILSGRVGLDLSVAAVMSTVAVIIAHLTGGKEALFLPVTGICLLFGATVGLCNGLLVTKRRVPPFMATLGIMIVLHGLRFIYTKGAPKGGFPPTLRFLGAGEIAHIPVPLIILAVLTAIAVIILKRTVLGREIYAIGGNLKTAFLSGHRVDFVVTVVYIISGLMAAIAGLLLGGWLDIADNWVGRGYELDSIAAAVMGGTSLHGGHGGVFGTIAGVFIIMILYNLVLVLGLPHETQIIVKGFVIILAASFWTIRSVSK